MKALVFGSMNIDHVYQLPHFLRPGETLASASYERNAGGKGLNQAVALARAGQQTAFAGGIGADGLFLRELLEKEGVDVSQICVGDTPTGHAIIHVDAQGGNAIVLYGGANQCVTQAQIARALDACQPGDLVLLQNEINLVPQIMEAAHARGLLVALNPSPASPEMKAWPLEMADYLLLNEVEGEDLTGEKEPAAMLDALLRRCPDCRVVLTLGEAGCLYAEAHQRHALSAMRVQAVDTTAAGDTFTGYFLQAMLEGRSVPEALRRATCASAMAVSRPGASASIPRRDEVETFLAAK